MMSKTLGTDAPAKMGMFSSMSIKNMFEKKSGNELIIITSRLSDYKSCHWDKDEDKSEEANAYT